ncbi:hypothetical protein K437DRAFT_129551 [Tilletiaria anomala UBC 951]|uniref:Uncharacterized protein n=1 Tax=Tilletiaria anomala (strain ATCC 24038 / CBS 436.72 / UBC 951) TaxID=1037660 RepID=A0A066W1R9_TILAU|nr:uncharacterized protein K437DRAFT_129551 [Tilletiaria anomala UBC 951]KDN44735.1 hypothetical protein K437DRAFT_129551 [Tilletiaria anomala UBC 951]
MSRASGSRRPRQANNDQLRAHGSELHAEAHLSEAQPPTPTLATSPSLLPVDLDREGLLPPSLQAGWRRKRTSEGLAAQAPSITRHRVDSGAAEEDVSGKISLQPRSEHEPTLPEAPALLPLARRSLRNTAPNHSTAASAAPPLPLRRSPRRLTRRLTDHDEHLTASSTDANRPAQSLSHWSPQRTPGLRSAAGKPGSIAGVEQQLGPSAGLSQRRQKQQHTRLSRRRAGGSRNTDMTDRRAELIQGGNRSSTPDNHGDQSQDDIMHLHRNPLLHTSSGDSSISLTSNSNRNGNGNSNSISGGGGPSPARGLLRHRRPLQEIPLWMADSRGEMIRRRSVMGTMSIGVGNGSRSNSGSDVSYQVLNPESFCFLLLLTCPMMACTYDSSGLAPSTLCAQHPTSPQYTVATRAGNHWHRACRPRGNKPPSTITFSVDLSD